jgi:hypothetical protein
MRSSSFSSDLNSSGIITNRMIRQIDCEANQSVCEWRSNFVVRAVAQFHGRRRCLTARVAYGWRVFEDLLGGIYLGPVLEYFGSEGYRHLRLGAHITSMKAEDTEWSAAAGWAQDSQG